MPKPKKRSRQAVARLMESTSRSGRLLKPSQRLKEQEDVLPSDDTRTGDQLDELPIHDEDSSHSDHLDDVQLDSQDLKAQLAVAEATIQNLRMQLDSDHSASSSNQKKKSHTSDPSSEGRQLSSSIPNTSQLTNSHNAQSQSQHSIHSSIPPTSDNSQAYRMPESITEDGIRSMLQDALTNMMKPTDVNNKGEQLITNYMLLGSTVDQKIKAKIWAGEYIELATLRDRLDPSLSVSVQQDGNPSFQLRPSKSSPPMSFLPWLRLFSIYASVYLQRYPEQASSIITYIIHILDLQGKHQGQLWRLYDEQFRQMRVYADIPWHKTNWDLMLQTMHNTGDRNNYFNSNQSFRKPRFTQTQTRFNQSQPQSQTSYRTPKGFCYAFDRSGSCRSQPNCRFRHDCTKCFRRGHSRVNCYSRMPGVQQPQQGQQSFNNQPNYNSQPNLQPSTQQTSQQINKGAKPPNKSQ